MFLPHFPAVHRRFLRCTGQEKPAYFTIPSHCWITGENFTITSLPEALDALEADHDYLTAGGVFPEELLQSFIKNKRAECSELSRIPHPAEFDRYYNL